MTSRADTVVGGQRPHRFRLQAVAERTWNRWPGHHAPPRYLILGNQKAGTSVVAAAIGETIGCDYQIDLPLERFAPTHQRRPPTDPNYPELVLARSARRTSRPVLKEPSLTFWWRTLASRWPSTRLVFVVREPLDNVRSILDRLGLLAEQTRTEGHHPGPGRSLDTDVDRPLPALPFPWHDLVELADSPQAGHHPVRTLDDVVANLGLRWELMARETLAARDAGHTVVRYEDFLSDPDAALDGLGLGPVPPSMLARRYQPQGANRHRDPAEVLGSRRVKLLVGVAPLAEAVGYSSSLRPVPNRRFTEPTKPGELPTTATRQSGDPQPRSRVCLGDVGESSRPSGKGARA